MYGDRNGCCKICQRPRRLAGGVCKDCLESHSLHDVEYLQSLITADRLLRRLHEARPWLGLDDARYIIKEACTMLDEELKNELA